MSCEISLRRHSTTSLTAESIPRLISTAFAPLSKNDKPSLMMD